MNDIDELLKALLDKFPEIQTVDYILYEDEPLYLIEVKVSFFKTLIIKLRPRFRVLFLKQVERFCEAEVPKELAIKIVLSI